MFPDPPTHHPAFFFLTFFSVRFWAFLGKGSSKTPQKYFGKNSVSKTFPKFSKKNRCQLFLDFFCFIGCFPAKFLSKFWEKFSTRNFCGVFELPLPRNAQKRTGKKSQEKKVGWRVGGWVGLRCSKCTGGSVDFFFGGPSGCYCYSDPQQQPQRIGAAPLVSVLPRSKDRGAPRRRFRPVRVSVGTAVRKASAAICRLQKRSFHVSVNSK
jgi:hypothetical protein